MCERYQRKDDEDELARVFSAGLINNISSRLKPNYNVHPNTVQPVIVWCDLDRVCAVESAFWAFSPEPTAQPKSRLDFNNARGEDLVSIPKWREAFLKRRCIVPVDSFVEWDRSDRSNESPWLFAMADDQSFGLAGVCQPMKSRHGLQQPLAFAIVTTTSNTLISEKTHHDRMPVILDPEDYRRWLQPCDQKEPPVDLLRPFDSSCMRAWRVSASINSTRARGRKLRSPLEEPNPQLWMPVPGACTA